MAIININGTVTLDESAGLQVGGVAVGQEDNDDNDILLATLQSQAATFYNRLFGVGGLGLTSLDVAKSGDNYITVTGPGSIESLGFTTNTGAALPVFGGADPGAACNLTALDGGTITLFRDSSLGNRVVLGVDSDGDIVFAMFLDPAADLLSAKVWMVQFEALSEPITTDHDDLLTLSGLGVGAGVSTEFDFNALPSGQNLFGTVGNTSSGLVVFGKTPVLNPDGTFTNASNTINTSQGGGPTTIGVDNQMFDPTDGAYFTYVRNPVPNFLAGAPGGLTQGEADDADNIQYTGGTIESDSAFVKIAQIQGNSLATMQIAAFNLTGSPQEEALIAARGSNPVAITAVRVYNAAGTLVEDSDGSPNSAAITITFGTGVGGGGNGIPVGEVRVSGLDAGYKVEWDTSGPHDQALITGVAGKFDIGGFGVNEATSIFAPLSGVQFEDDGPSVDIELEGDAELVVDESILSATASLGVGTYLSTNNHSFGTDGAGTDDSVYKLLLSDDNSGLLDTETGDEVLLSINLAGTLITGIVNDGVSDQTVFTIEVDPDTGEVTLTQMRAMVHGDPNDPDEEDTPLTLPNGLVGLERTVTDGDGDSASDDVDISPLFKFEDAGPIQPGAGQDIDNLITDDSFITDDASETTDDIFPDAPNFGSDGPRATNPITFNLELRDPFPLDGDDPDSGLIDTETLDAIRFVTVGNDIVGYVDLDGDGVISVGEKVLANEAVRYSLVPVVGDPDSFDVTFTQTRAVFHAPAATEETVLPNTVFVERHAFDGDSDPAEVVDFDLGAITFLLDDEPAIGPIPDGLVDFELNSSVNNSLEGVVGNDPNASPYVLTFFTPSIEVDGVTVTGVAAADNKSVTYWANTNGNGIIGDAGDTAYYSMVLGDQGGEGDYTFTVLIDPPPAFTEFTFDLLPSGANLFGVVTSGNSALLVMGEDPEYNAAGNYTNASDVIHTSQGGDGATIGVNNQMFDPGDGAYFTFINDPDPNFISGIPGGLTATEADNINNVQYNEDLVGPPTKEVDSAFLGISQTQSNKPVSMTIEAFNITGGPQEEAFDAALGSNHVDITAVRVKNALGVDISASVSISIVGGVATVGGLLRGYTVEWDTAAPHDQVLVTGATGKFDVGRFGFLEGNDTPDQLLSFTAKVTDGDGDFATDSWNIGIDGTGIHDNDDVIGVSII